MTGLIVAIVVLLIAILFLAIGYLKAPPDTAFIISGLGKKRILIGKAGWRIPFFERVDKLSLKVMTVDVKTSEAVPTNEFINVMVDGVANVKVSSDPELLTRAAEAQRKMGEASILEMYLSALPEVVKNAAAPLAQTDRIVMYGDGNSTKLIRDVMNSSNQIVEGLKESTGIDLAGIIAGFAGGKLAVGAQGESGDPAQEQTP